MSLNYALPHLPSRDNHPRKSGLTMMMDKGLGLKEAENVVEASGQYIDFVKFGFGTSLLSPQVKEKINVYKQAGLKPYFGGTLFELFLVRGMFDDFCRYVDTYKLEIVEVSDGSIKLPHEEKLSFIEKLSKRYTVFSEVGSKLAHVELSDEKWAAMCKAELNAGAWKVIAEAREAGNIGIYKSDGSANKELISHITSAVAPDNILWEAPIKSQQVWFIKLMGANVNLGNIAPTDVIPLETLRLGLRGDTFFQFLPEALKTKYSQ